MPLLIDMKKKGDLKVSSLDLRGNPGPASYRGKGRRRVADKFCPGRSHRRHPVRKSEARGAKKGDGAHPEKIRSRNYPIVLIRISDIGIGPARFRRGARLKEHDWVGAAIIVGGEHVRNKARA